MYRAVAAVINVILTSGHLFLRNHSFPGTTPNFDYGMKAENTTGGYDHSAWSDTSGDAEGEPVSLSRNQSPVGITGICGKYLYHTDILVSNRITLLQKRSWKKV